MNTAFSDEATFTMDGMVNSQKVRNDGDEYHRLLRYTAIPALKKINGGTLDVIYWQQDGAKFHSNKNVLMYLNGQFGPGMFALDSVQGVEWPPRSPTLNPLDFFVW